VRGYTASPVVYFDVGHGESIEFVPMRKSLVLSPANQRA
jgi:hypothetical protein